MTRGVSDDSHRDHSSSNLPTNGTTGLPFQSWVPLFLLVPLLGTFW
jgi:hypothetical protein